MKMVLAVMMAMPGWALAETIHTTTPTTIEMPLDITVNAKPLGPQVPFKITCYKRNFTPFIAHDEKGNILFEVKCP